ncbi:MAG TPA: S41 family peptidase [Gemmatimonadales bacterium]|nr:S41 family peptidase [Gemmatimonadales bacterium]
MPRFLRARPALLVLPLLAAAVLLGARRFATAPEPVDGARLFRQVFERVASEGLGAPGEDKLYEQAARGLLQAIDDPYADLFSPEQLGSFQRNTMRNDYAGVGMQIEAQPGRTVVAAVFPGSPAEQGGVLQGDRIVAVNDTSVKGRGLSEISGRLLGVAGTRVIVTFERPGVPEPITMTFTRARIHVPSVPYALMLEDGVGYVPLPRFNNTSAAEVEMAFRGLEKRGARAYVLDLRRNLGGVLEQAAEISELFLAPGQEIVRVDYRNQPTEVHVATRVPVVGDKPLVVLIDDQSASASEIVAGALQDHDRALVVGETSYGKGVVQSLYPLDDGWALRITTAEWKTPSGRSIHRPRSRDGTPVPPDTTEPGLLFRSDRGRPIKGGGGVSPDVAVLPDTMSTAEQSLARAIAPRSQAVYAGLTDLALGARSGLKPDFRVREAWRTRFGEILAESGVEATPEELLQARPLVDRWIEQQVARAAFGDSTAFRRRIVDDSQLRRAMALLRKGKTQAQLFALSERQEEPSRVN